MIAKALARALIDGKAEPASEAAKLKAELEHEQRRFEALILASDNAHKQIGQLVAEHKTAWPAKATRELDRAKRRYEAAIQELAAARDELENAATLLNWLSGGEGSSAATDAPPADTAIRLWASPAYSRSCGVTLSIRAMEPLAMIEAENPRSISPAGPACAECESAPPRRAGEGSDHASQPAQAAAAGEESGAARRREEDPVSPAAAEEVITATGFR